MSLELNQILDLVGTLDDSPGEDTPRERFRGHLRRRVLKVGQLRDYVEECLRTKGAEYDRALQDLVNYIGRFLEFEVSFGRYQGVAGQIGFDGHWESPTGFHVVVEVKTSEAFAIRTSTLVGYVDELISQQKIPNWKKALGLYVLGRPDPEIRQLENAIVAEERTDQLRVISVDSLLSLAELMGEYDIDHEEVLAVIRPSGPRIDPIVDLMTALVVEPTEKHRRESPVREEEPSYPEESEAAHWLTPVKSVPEQSAEDCIRTLVSEEQIYAFGERTPGRKHIKPGDWLCFYITGGKGISGHARIASYPEKSPHSKVRQSERYPWVFRLKDTQLYIDNPIVIDAELRAKLDAFQDKDPESHWAWFVQSTSRLTQHDFHLLTRQ